LRYQIVLQRGEFLGSVPETWVFRQGDRIRLVVEGNATGYLYIFHKGSSGRASILYPRKRGACATSQIRAHAESVVPATGWFEFDETPGTEKLYVLYTPKRVKALEEVIHDASVRETTWQATITTIVQRKIRSLRSTRTKDIVYVEPSSEEETTQREGVQDPHVRVYISGEFIDDDGVLIREICLRHE
jgi:hypothetical protein